MGPLSTVWTALFCGTLLALTGCGKQGRSVDPKLLPYVQEFEQRYGVYFAGDVSIEDLPDRAIGECTIDLYNSTIIFDKEYFNKLSTDAIQLVMYHEMGHCTMYLDHTETFNNGCQTSIMHYQFDYSMLNCFKNNKEFYFKELETTWKKQSGFGWD